MGIIDFTTGGTGGTMCPSVMGGFEMVRLPKEKPVGNYVYKYIVNGTPRYIGLGVNDRYRHHLVDGGRVTRWATFLKYHLAKGSDVKVIIVADDLTKDDQRALEIELIAKYGRKIEGGKLLNMTPGGDFLDPVAARHIARERNANPEHIEIQRNNALEQHKDPKQKELRSRAAKKQWADPEWRAANIAKLKAADRSKISKKVRCVETGVVYRSVAEAARMTGIFAIDKVARGKRPKAGGFRWEYTA